MEPEAQIERPYDYFLIKKQAEEIQKGKENLSCDAVHDSSSFMQMLTRIDDGE